MKKIASRQNPEIKEVAKLKLQKERKNQKKFLAEGLRVCKTLIDTGATLFHLYVTESSIQKTTDMFPADKITIVSDIVMKKIAPTVSPSGILGVFEIPQEPDTSKLGPGLVLANVSNPGNMGTLIRSCTAMGFKSVVTIEGTDPWGPKVIQASAGEIAKVSLFSWSWEKLQQEHGTLPLVALVVEDGKKPQELDLKHSLLVVGSEAHGIPQSWIDDCQEKLTIEMPGKTESLNAAVAGSIALYLAGTQ